MPCIHVRVLKSSYFRDLWRLGLKHFFHCRRLTGCGTATLIKKLEDYILEHGAVIKTSVTIQSLQPEEKFVLDNEGNRTDYTNLIWAGDLKQMYNIIPVESLKNSKLKDKIQEKRALLKDLKGGDSVFTVYLSVQEKKEYFEKICTGHFFYTPDKRGSSIVSKEEINEFLSTSPTG